jgi:hypothetical protein
MVAWLLLVALAAPEMWCEPLLNFPPPDSPSDSGGSVVRIDTARGESASALLVVQADEALTGAGIEIKPPHDSLPVPEVFVAQEDGTLLPAAAMDFAEDQRVVFLLRFASTAESRSGLHEGEVILRAEGLRRSRKIELAWRVRRTEYRRALVPPVHAGVDLDALPAEAMALLAGLAPVGGYPFDFFPLRGRNAAQPGDYPLLAQATPGAAAGRPPLIGPVFASQEERGLLKRQSLDQTGVWAEHLKEAYWTSGARVLVDTPDAAAAQVQSARIEQQIPNTIAVVSGGWHAFAAGAEERAVPWDARLLSPGGASAIETLPECAGMPASVRAMTGSPGQSVPGASGALYDATAAGDCCPATGWSPAPGGGAWLAWDFHAPLRIERLRIAGVFGLDLPPPTVMTAFPGQAFTPSTVDWSAPRAGVLDGVLKYPAEFAALRLDFAPPAGTPIIIAEVMWSECGSTGAAARGVWLTPPGGPFDAAALDTATLTAAGWGILAGHVRGLILPLPGVTGGVATATLSGEVLRDALEDDALLYGLGAEGAALAREFIVHAAKQLRGEADAEWMPRALELKESLRRNLD